MATGTQKRQALGQNSGFQRRQDRAQLIGPRSLPASLFAGDLIAGMRPSCCGDVPRGVHAAYNAIWSELVLDSAPTSLSAAVGLATETDLASALGDAKAKAFTGSTEADSAFARGRIKSLAAGLSTETDLASALSALGAIEAPVGLATESDEAFALTVQRRAEQPSGGWLAYNDSARERRRREEEDEADRLERLLIEEGKLPPNPVLDDRIIVREYALQAEAFNRRTQRAIDYALKAKTDLAYQLAAREIANQLEDEEYAVLLLLAAA